MPHSDVCQPLVPFLFCTECWDQRRVVYHETHLYKLDAHQVSFSTGFRLLALTLRTRYIDRLYTGMVGHPAARMLGATPRSTGAVGEETEVYGGEKRDG